MAVLQAVRRNGLRDNSSDQDGAGPGGDHQPHAAVSAGLQQEHFCCMFMELGESVIQAVKPNPPRHLLEHHCL